MGKLTDVEIKRAKEPGKLSDGHGLHLLIAPNGSKLWRYNYRFSAKHRTLGARPVPCRGVGSGPTQARRRASFAP
jgi:Arm DNA-binding domain